MSKKKTSKKTNGKNFVVRAECVVLAVAVVAAGVCCTGFASRGADGKWFGNGDIKTWHWSDKAPDDNQEEEVKAIPKFAGGMYVTSTAGDGFDLLSAQIPVAAYAENGLVGYADNAYTITATVKPDNYATNTGVEWVLAWANPESEWATGKTVTDYVTATPSGAGYMESKIVNLTCAQAFGEQVLLTAKAKEKPEVTAVATVDYVQRLEEKNVGLKFGEIECNFDLEYKKNPLLPNAQVPIPGSNATEIPLQLSAYGDAAGGMPEAIITQPDEPYTLAGNYMYSYKLSNNDVFAKYSNDTFSEFYVFADDTVAADFPDIIWTYNVAEKGLFFSLKYFIEEMPLYRTTSEMHEYERLTIENIQSYAEVITRWFNNKGTTADDGYTYDSENKLFLLTFTVSGDFGDIKRTTFFKIGSIVNTTNSIDDIELTPPSVSM